MLEQHNGVDFVRCRQHGTKGVWAWASVAEARIVPMCAHLNASTTSVGDTVWPGPLWSGERRSKQRANASTSPSSGTMEACNALLK